MRMSHARLQGRECNGKVEHTCYMPDFKEVSVMER